MMPRKKYYNPQQRKKVAQCLYTRALDHFISFLAIKDRNIYYTRFQDEMEKKEGMAYTLVMEVVYEKNRNSSSKSRKS